LGVNENSSIEEIKNNYVKLTINYHPDINKNADPQLFELIQNAWNCLSDLELKNKYDEMLSMKKENDLKKDFEKFRARKYNKEYQKN
jgi:DnaJ-class molecular chaperone